MLQLGDGYVFFVSNILPKWMFGDINAEMKLLQCFCLASLVLDKFGRRFSHDLLYWLCGFNDVF